MGIDSHGDEGGYYINTSNSIAPWYPFVYIGGTTYPLNQPASDEPYYTAWGAGITALNTNGQAVGFSTPGNPEDMNAAVWTYAVSGGSVTSQTATNIQALVRAQYPTAVSSELVAINSSGTAVGQWSSTYMPGILLSAESGSFIYNVGNSTFTSLGGLLVGNAGKPSSTHGAGMSEVINDSGAVVGCIVNTANTSGYDAAIWKNGTITDLNTLYAPVLPARLSSSTTPRPSTTTATSPAMDTTPTGTPFRRSSLQALLPGDANEDGTVDINDLTVVLAHYGQSRQ